MNEWKRIWSGRTTNQEIIKGKNEKEIFLELKRSSGFDMGDGLTYEALLEQYQYIKGKLFDSKYHQSIYEVGCGGGANLFLFELEGVICGGVDYSEIMIETAKKVLKTKDLTCDEAVNISSEEKYDAILSNSVFSYFVDLEYAEKVLEKMVEKTNYSIGIIDIHDKDKEADFLKYRRRTVSDYDERYKNLPKLFYSKEFFVEFASKHGLEIVFVDSTMKGYWNNEFVFNCFMYKE